MLKEKEYMDCEDCGKSIEIKRDKDDSIIFEECPYCSNEFDTADVCEEAHKRTKEECKDKGITLDKPFIEGNEQHYTGEAQTIFNRHFDEVEEEFENKIK